MKYGLVLSVNNKASKIKLKMKKQFLFLLLLVIFTACLKVQAQWIQTSGPYGVCVDCMAFSGSNLFAGTSGKGIYLSTDNGTSWTAINNGISNSIYGNAASWIYSILVDSAETGLANIFAGTKAGIFLSTDNGRNWTAVDSNLMNFPIFSFTISHPGKGKTNIFAGTYHGVFLSTDHGVSWSAENSDLADTIVWKLAISPDSTGGTNLFTGTYNGGIFLSTNYGTNWSYKGLAYYPVYSLDVIFSQTNYETNLFVGSGDRICHTTDNGTTWKVVWKAENDLENNIAYSIIDIPNETSGINIFAGAGTEGVLISTDNGTNWVKVDSGFASPNVCSLLKFGDYLYAGTYTSGVWKRQLSDMITKIIETPNNLSNNFSLQQNYPNPFNPTTIISYSVSISSLVTIKIYDILGKEIQTLVNEEKHSGNFEVEFDGSKYSNGVYFYRMQAGDFIETKKLILLK